MPSISAETGTRCRTPFLHLHLHSTLLRFSEYMLPGFPGSNLLGVLPQDRNALESHPTSLSPQPSSSSAFRSCAGHLGTRPDDMGRT